jgi:hypothetical protein
VRPRTRRNPPPPAGCVSLASAMSRAVKKSATIQYITTAMACSQYHTRLLALHCGTTRQISKSYHVETSVSGVRPLHCSLQSKNCVGPRSKRQDGSVENGNVKNCCDSSTASVHLFKCFEQYNDHDMFHLIGRCQGFV